MCSVFVLVRIRGDAEPLQDAREALVSAWLVHLAPEAKRRDFMSSCPHQYEKGVVYHSFFVLIRVWGNEESLQDAREVLIFSLLVHLAPCETRVSCPHINPKFSGFYASFVFNLKIRMLRRGRICQFKYVGSVSMEKFI